MRHILHGRELYGGMFEFRRSSRDPIAMLALLQDLFLSTPDALKAKMTAFRRDFQCGKCLGHVLLFLEDDGRAVKYFDVVEVADRLLGAVAEAVHYGANDVLAELCGHTPGKLPEG